MTSKITKYALAFPGQGIYKNGFLESVRHHQPLFQHYLDQIDETLNENFSSHLFANESESDAKLWLGKTSNAQPATLASTYILLKLTEKLHNVSLVDNASFFLGHSLGEYTALVLSGIIDFSTGLKLVRKRGELMEELCHGGNYGMIALLVKPKFTDQVINSAQEHHVLGNINSPSQIVISGELTQLEKYIETLKKENKSALMRSVPLPVSIPFHTDILKPIVPELRGILTGKLNKQKTPIVSNLDGEPSYEAESTVEKLLDANYQPVQWLKSMNYLEASPVETVFNLGPGTTLQGINSRYKIESMNLDNTELTDDRIQQI
ncbi:fabD Malonyl CoA-acyl carrier protein transacylase [Candida maltosa Xu316]|uniref:[acyl-carrier-protein] S-malonyltransferase n=1 Tax=Candida maltosa (strain Xu316) TaxID=1245528 RepID=M3J907_CANMX|nr:hypothetical protein G210_0849 [Candida maltosa Xu316]